MARWISGAAAAALCISGGSAWALTAQEAWEGWQALSASMGQPLEAEAVKGKGGTITVTGITFARDMQDTAITGRIDEAVFTERGDGTVAVSMSDSYSMSVATTPEPGETFTADLTVAMPGLELVAKDAPEGGIGFDYQAPEIAISIDSLSYDDEAFPLEMTITLSGVAGTYAGQAEPPQMASNFTAASAAMVMSAREPGGSGAFDMTLNVADISSVGEGSGSLLLLDPDDLPALFAAGFAASGTTSFGQTEVALKVADTGENFEATAQMEGGTARATLSGGAIDVASTYRGFAFSATGSDIPLPRVTGGAGEFTTEVLMPLTETDAAVPVGLRLALVDMTMGEEIWSLFDPAGALPRDPATLVLDVDGTAQMLVSLLDEEAMVSADEPALLESLNLTELRLALAGALLTGTGAFTFDNNDRTTFDGMPAPDGSVSLSLTGGNALLDKLVQMGLLPEDQAMMARMMTGMLAKPGPNPDQLVSEITVRPDGTILANGAPLPF